MKKVNFIQDRKSLHAMKIEQGLTSHWTQKGYFRDASQVIFWLGTEKTKLNKLIQHKSKVI